MTSAASWEAVSSIASVVTAAAALLTVVVGAIAAVLALRQLRQGRALSEERARPYVFVALEPNEVLRSNWDLVIKNVGLTAAIDTRISIDPPFERADPIDGHAFMDARLFTAPIPTLPPGAGYRFLMEDVPEHDAKPDHPSVYRVDVNFLDRNRKQHHDVFYLDLDILKGTVYVDQLGIHDVAKSLRKLSDRR